MAIIHTFAFNSSNNNFISLFLPMAGIYVHIPFCKSRCIYCGFYSTTLFDYQAEYVESLIKELDDRKDYLGSEPVKTIYIGGGTPSLLKPSSLKRLCTALQDSPHLIYNIEEFTMECNPDDITDEYASLIASLGINRVSMGAQTFSDERLAFLHRRHRSGDVRKAVETLRRNGIDNISIDLMFGFPDENLNDWQSDIDEALSLGVQHISAYSLMYEEGTPLFRLLNEKKIKEINEETSLKMYEMLIESLTSNGFEHYEISNFALPGYRSKHNSSYWKQIPYLGIGASAHSYNIVSRQWNISDVKDYIRFVNSSSHEYIEETEHLTDTERYNDIITTTLRTSDGIDTRTLPQRHRDFILKASQKHIALGNLSLDNGIIRLTRQGLFISDSIMVDLIEE